MNPDPRSPVAPAPSPASAAPGDENLPAGATHTHRAPNRRRVVGVVAALAASLGAGVSWRTHRAPDPDNGLPSTPESGTASAAPSAPPAASSPGPARAPARLVTLDGRTLTPDDWKGRPLVLNFWAPWCGPCVKEMPELDRFSKAQGPKGALVIGLAIDEEAAVRKFLASHSIGFPICVLGFAGLSLARGLANDSNVALPFTAVFSIDGTLSHRKFGPTDVDELTHWVRGGA